MDILIVVDMQNDFITGTLGTAEAQAIVENVADKIKTFNGKIIFLAVKVPEGILVKGDGDLSRFTRP